MEKDAYYFPHFSNARHDRKIKRITKELGVEGYGIFFMILEVLREQTSLKYPMSDIDLLAYEFGTSEQKVRTVICNYSLFDIDQDEMFYSKKLFEYLKPYFTIKRQRKEAAESRWAKHREIKALEESKEVQSDSESNTGLMRPHSDRITTEMQSKVKESKVKESKKNNKDIIDFEKFMSSYNSTVKGVMPKILKMDNKRKAALRKLLKTYTEQEIFEAIKKASESVFIQTEGNWCNIDWLLKEQNIIKVIEGNYDNKTTYSQNGHSTENYGLPPDFKIEVDYFPPDPRKSPYPINKKTQMLIKGEKYIFDNPYKDEMYHVDEQGRIIKTEKLTD